MVLERAEALKISRGCNIEERNEICQVEGLENTQQLILHIACNRGVFLVGDFGDFFCFHDLLKPLRNPFPPLINRWTISPQDITT
jgi:hypothetical protein